MVIAGLCPSKFSVVALQVNKTILKYAIAGYADFTKNLVFFVSGNGI